MLQLFQAKQGPLLGIDIRSTTVKLLELSLDKGIFVVEHYGYEVLPSYALDGIVVKDRSALAHCIKKILNRIHPHTKKAALALPDSAVINKTIQINEGLTEEEMEEVILEEASHYIPFPINELSLDFEILGSSTKKPNSLDVLLVASRVEHVNHRVEAVVQAGLEVLAVDVVSYAVERAAQHALKNFTSLGQTFAIIDMGLRETHLFVLQEMRLIYSREEQFGGNQLAQSMQWIQDSILVQIKRSLQFFYATNQGRALDHILLAGELAKHTDLVSWVQKELNIPTTLANPFASMKLGKKVDPKLLDQDASALMVACGLSLRRRYDEN
jgi:type IV pilus assembly protein PilM